MVGWLSMLCKKSHINSVVLCSGLVRRGGGKTTTEKDGIKCVTK